MITLLLVACDGDVATPIRRTTDVFAQPPARLIDVLFVVSEAPASAPAREALGAGIGAFQDALDAADGEWQVGVTSARLGYEDPHRGELLGDPAVIRAGQDLAALLPARLPDGVEDHEQGLGVASAALHPSMTARGGPNEGLVRPGSDLVVVFVSAQDDEGQDPLAEFVLDLDPAAVAAWVPPDTRYETAATLLGGPVHDPDEADWGPTLAELGASLGAEATNDAFQLSRSARAATLEVTVDGVDVPEDEVDGWTYDEASWFLTFHGDAVPPRGAEIVASYQVDR